MQLLSQWTSVYGDVAAGVYWCFNWQAVTFDCYIRPHVCVTTLDWLGLRHILSLFRLWSCWGRFITPALILWPCWRSRCAFHSQLCWSWIIDYVGGRWNWLGCLTLTCLLLCKLSLILQLVFALCTCFLRFHLAFLADCGVAYNLLNLLLMVWLGLCKSWLLLWSRNWLPWLICDRPAVVNFVDFTETTGKTYGVAIIVTLRL